MRAVSILLLAAGCAGAKDEGQVPEQPVDADGDGFTAAEDCDDENPNARPNAVELWYDGLDADCLGDDDFDQDGDGHSAEEFGGDDCVDANGDISPSAPETHYDGLDNDCDPLSIDDDLDGDGFILAQDCDDQHAGMFPGALERLGNGLDDDCAGGADLSPFVTGDLAWSGLSRPHLSATDDWIVIAVAAQQLSSPTYVPEPVSSVAALLTLDPLGTTSDSLGAEPFLWKGELDDDELGAVDLGSWDGELVAATAYWSDVNRFGWMMILPLSWQGAGVGWRQGTASFRSTPLVDYDQVDLAFDASGTPWLCATDLDSLAYMRGDGLLASAGSQTTGDGTRGCLAEPSEGELAFTSISATGELLSWQAALDSPEVSLSQPYASEHWSSVRERDGLVTAIPYSGDGLAYFVDGQRTSMLEGHEVQEGEVAVASDGSVWAAAVVQVADERQLLLAYGDPAAPTEIWLLPSGADIQPAGASLWLTDDRVLVAVTGTKSGTGVVGWLMMGRPL